MEWNEWEEVRVESMGAVTGEQGDRPSLYRPSKWPQEILVFVSGSDGGCVVVSTIKRS